MPSFFDQVDGAKPVLESGKAPPSGGTEALLNQLGYDPSIRVEHNGPNTYSYERGVGDVFTPVINIGSDDAEGRLPFNTAYEAARLHNKQSRAAGNMAGQLHLSPTFTTNPTSPFEVAINKVQSQQALDEANYRLANAGYPVKDYAANTGRDEANDDNIHPSSIQVQKSADDASNGRPMNVLKNPYFQPHFNQVQLTGAVPLKDLIPTSQGGIWTRYTPKGSDKPQLAHIHPDSLPFYIAKADRAGGDFSLI